MPLFILLRVAIPIQHRFLAARFPSQGSTFELLRRPVAPYGTAYRNHLLLEAVEEIQKELGLSTQQSALSSVSVTFEQTTFSVSVEHICSWVGIMEYLSFRNVRYLLRKLREAYYTLRDARNVVSAAALFAPGQETVGDTFLILDAFFRPTRLPIRGECVGSLTYAEDQATSVLFKTLVNRAEAACADVCAVMASNIL